MADPTYAKDTNTQPDTASKLARKLERANIPGHSLGCVCEVCHAARCALLRTHLGEERPHKNSGNTKLLMKFWAAMHSAGIKDGWDAQERISITDLQNLLERGR